MWPFDVVSKTLAERRLRQECLDEIIGAARQGGIELVEVFLNRNKDPELNRARIVLENLKTSNTPYSIEFYVLQDYSPIGNRGQNPITFQGPRGIVTVSRRKYIKLKRDILIKRFKNGDIMYYVKGLDEQIPQGFIKPPIASSRNPKTEEVGAYWKKRWSIGKEILRERAEEVMRYYERQRNAWLEIPMDEWQRRIDAQGGRCPDCRGEKEVEVDIDSDTQRGTMVKCRYCNGSGKGTAEMLKHFYAPSFSSTSIFNHNTYDEEEKRMLDLGIPYPGKTPPLFLVYAKIEPKR